MRQPCDRPRGGYTLMELLVVIAILAILMGMVASALFPQYNRANLSNTRVLLKKLDKGLSQQWSEAFKTAQRSAPPQGVLDMAGGNERIARVIWVKLQMKAEFPQSYAEALAPFGNSPFLASCTLPAIEYYRKALKGRIQAIDPQTEAAACLLLALERPRAGQKFNAEQALGASALKDSDGDGIMEIVDLWGTAVGFYRWGTGNPDLDVLNTNARGFLDRDKEDVDHVLMDNRWNVLGTNVPQGVAEFQRLVHAIRENNAPRSWYTEPVVVSAGKDGRLGLDWWMNPVSPAVTNHIYGFKLR